MTIIITIIIIIIIRHASGNEKDFFEPAQ